MGISRFLIEKGARDIVAGDTTVAYSGPRGHKENPKGNVSKYLKLARKHGWSESGNAGVSFVVLDRPSTSKPHKFEFVVEQESFKLNGLNNFNDFYIAGGFNAADFVVNNAHLTLHGLAGVAGCVKSIAMGCSGLTGKLRMHQSLLPHFDSTLCAGCGLCIESCPENALSFEPPKTIPIVDPEACTGCGECEAICAVGKNAIKLCGEDITDWNRGHQSLPIRMADYTIGLMNGKWDSTIHVLHMYAVTKRCDCLNIKQKPILKKDLGFLIGKNPFAVDRLAVQMLTEALDKEVLTVYEPLLKSIETTAGYVYENYGILTEVPVERITVS
jgi:ferredoxin